MSNKKRTKKQEKDLTDPEAGYAKTFTEGTKNIILKPQKNTKVVTGTEKIADTHTTEKRQKHREKMKAAMERTLKRADKAREEIRKKTKSYSKLRDRLKKK